MFRVIILALLLICTSSWMGCGAKSQSVVVVPTEKPVISGEKTQIPSVQVKESTDFTVKTEPTHEDMQSQMKALFPEDEAVAGWKKGEGITFFREDNLYEHIDGAADTFFAYGFRLCGTADYVSDPVSSEFIRVDIYDMGRNIQTFGMYASERYEGMKAIDIGTEGYVESSILNFWKGHYYVKISASSPSENLDKASLEIAKNIARNIPGKSEKPSMLLLLPRENLLPDTEKFILSNILGYDFLKNGVSAAYRVGNEDKTLIIMECISVEDAKDRFIKFTRFEEGTGSVMKTTNAGEEGFFANDRYYKRILVARQNRYLFVTLAVTDDASALELIKKAMENVSKGI